MGIKFKTYLLSLFWQLYRKYLTLLDLVLDNLQNRNESRYKHKNCLFVNCGHSNVIFKNKYELSVETVPYETHKTLS